MQSTDSDGRANTARNGHETSLQSSAAAVAWVGTGRARAPAATGNAPSSMSAPTMLQVFMEFSSAFTEFSRWSLDLFAKSPVHPLTTPALINFSQLVPL